MLAKDSKLINVLVVTASSSFFLWNYYPHIIKIVESLSLSFGLSKPTPIIELPEILSTRSIRKTHIVEICLSDIQSIKNAIQGGANSVELCCERINGGITPSIGLVKSAVDFCSKHDVEVHVLIRPRAGLFTYSEDEFDTIIHDILSIKDLGITGNSYFKIENFMIIIYF